MKVKIISRSESALEEALNYGEHEDAIMIEEDGVVVFSVHDGETEDNNLSRNFSDVHCVGNLLMKYYLLGKEGVMVDFEIIETDEEF